MVELETFLAFCVATTILILLPGPIVTLTIANSLTYGTRHGLRTVIGTSCATAVLLLVGGLGMASIFGLLAEWFEWIRWAGAAYLVYLGIQQWRERVQTLGDVHAEHTPLKSLFWQGFMVSITNPKTIFFYAALFPQFIDPARDTGPQLLTLSIAFLIIACTLDAGYAFLSGQLRPWLTGERRGRIRNRITAILLMGTGIGIALVRRN